jgi:5-oxoprolinase (ATP-hydrolysing) subunit C
MTLLRVLTAGAATTVQASGRDGWRHVGVARGGALDPAQATLANHMVGNAHDDAVLEIALGGPTLAFDAPIRIALCGAPIDASFDAGDGVRRIVPNGRPVALPAGTLKLGTIHHGLRAWLAVAGGIDVPSVLGSRGTDLRGGFGGLQGRTLRVGDALPLGLHAPIDADAPRHPPWWVCLDGGPANASPFRFVLSLEPVAMTLSQRAWRVDPRSDRQGLRFSGEPLQIPARERLSAPVAPGTIQLPPDGQPIVLLADAQTVGGYPRLGYVIATDLPRMAQLRAGDTVRFEQVEAAEAERLRRQRQSELARALIAVDAQLQSA